MDNTKLAKHNNIQLYLVYIVIIIGFFDNFSLLPVISPYAVMLGASIFLAGIIVATYSFSNMVGNFFAGFFMNKLGRINTIALGLIIGSLGVLSYSLIRSPSELLVARVIHGMGMAIVVPALFTLVGDMSDKDSRGKDMAKTGIAISIAAILGPALGGIIKSYFGIERVFYLVSSLLLFGALVTKMMLRETFLISKKEGGQKRDSKYLLNLIFKPELLVAYLAAYFLMMAKGTLATILPLQVEQLGFSAAITGILFTSFALASIVVFIMYKVIGERGRYSCIMLGLFLISISLGLLTFGKTLITLIPIMIGYGLGFGFLFPACTALVADNTNLENRGYAFGIFYAVFSLGVVIGPIISGFMANLIHPFLLISIVLLVGLSIIAILVNRIKKYLEVTT